MTELRVYWRRETRTRDGIRLARWISGHDVDAGCATHASIGHGDRKHTESSGWDVYDAVIGRGRREGNNIDLATCVCEEPQRIDSLNRGSGNPVRAGEGECEINVGVDDEESWIVRYRCRGGDRQ